MHRQRYGLPLRIWPLLAALGGVAGGWTAVDAAWADERASVPTPRANLDRLLACQNADLDAIMAKKREVLATRSKIVALLNSLTEAPIHSAAKERATRALAVADDAIAKIDAQIALSEKKVGMTVRALRYLAPAQGGVTKTPENDAQRVTLDQEAGGSDLSREVDEKYAREPGYVDNPALVKRLTALVARLQVVSAHADVPIEVKILAPGKRLGTLSTATTIYFAQDELDLMPSDSELLWTAAHELAHVQLGHFSRTMIGLRAEAERLADELGPDVTDVIGERTWEAMMDMRSGPWEKPMEEAADLLGTQLALEAGASPKGIHDAFMRMAEHERRWAARLKPDVRRLLELQHDHEKPMVRLKALETMLGDRFWERTDLNTAVDCPS